MFSKDWQREIVVCIFKYTSAVLACAIATVAAAAAFAFATIHTNQNAWKSSFEWKAREPSPK